MKILLTGATGFVGSHTAAELCRRGHEVHALVRQPVTGRNAKVEFLKNLGVHFIEGDLASLGTEQDCWPNFDVVIHVAGLIKAKRTNEFYSVNVEGTRLLLEKIKGQPLKKFIFISSIAARGPNKDRQDNQGIGPVCHYGRSKLIAEGVVLKYRSYFPVVLVRPPVVYGPGDRETLSLFKMFKKGFFPVMGREKRRISFVYVVDLAGGLASMAEQDFSSAGPFYPEEGVNGHNWDKVLGTAEVLFKKKIREVAIPLWIGKCLAGVSEAGGRVLNKTALFNRDKFEEIKHPFWFCSSESLRKAYQLSSATNLNKGFRITKEWYEGQGWL